MGAWHRTAVPAAVSLVLALAAGCVTVGGGPRPAPSGPGAASAPAGPSSASARPVPGPYAALGDSYTSGPQVLPQAGAPAGCLRSGANYPSVVAGELGLGGADFHDVSCNGARTTDLTGPQRTADGTNPPQLDALTPQTRLVTVGIGGNDAGFMDVLTRCARESLRRSQFPGDAAAAPCRAAYAVPGGGADEVQRKVEAAGAKVTAVLGEIRRRAPHAAVYLVGYPILFPADGATCAQTLGDAVAAGDLAFLAEKQQQLNAMMRGSADAAGVHFVDTAAASVGHDMCAGPGRRWIEPVVPAAAAAPLHPNALGERGMAEAVLAAVRG